MVLSPGSPREKHNTTYRDRLVVAARNNVNPSPHLTEVLPLRTPWDDADLDLVLVPANDDPIPRINMKDHLAFYLPILPIGENNPPTYWQDKWDSCSTAKGYCLLLQEALEYERKNMEQVQATVGHVLGWFVEDTDRQSFHDEAQSDPPSLKRASEDDHEDDTDRAWKRTRVTEKGSPVSSRTRMSARAVDEPAPSTMTPSAPQTPIYQVDDNKYVTNNDTLILIQTHKQIHDRLEELYTLTLDAEATESQLEPFFNPEPKSEDTEVVKTLTYQLKHIESQVKLRSDILNKLTDELSGLINVHASRPKGKYETRIMAQMNRYRESKVEGLMGYWIETMRMVQGKRD